MKAEYWDALSLLGLIKSIRVRKFSKSEAYYLLKLKRKLLWHICLFCKNSVEKPKKKGNHMLKNRKDTYNSRVMSWFYFIQWFSLFLPTHFFSFFYSEWEEEKCIWTKTHIDHCNPPYNRRASISSLKIWLTGENNTTDIGMLPDIWL